MFFQALLLRYYDDVAVMHCSSAKRNAFNQYKDRGFFIITTVRDWGDCYESWKARSNNLTPFWDTLIAWHDWVIQNADAVVSIDGDREHRLKNLGRLLGIDLQTDWEVVNSR